MRLFLAVFVAALALPVSAASAQSSYLEISDGVARKAVTALFTSGISVSVDLYRGGQLVGTASGRRRATLAVDPQAGDLYRLRNGQTVMAEYTWDGTPTIEPAACVGQATFGGRRASADTVIERAGAFVPGASRYAPTSQMVGTVTTPTTATYAVALPGPLAATHVVYAVGRRQVASLLVRMAVERSTAPASACVDRAAPRASLRLSPVRLRTLLRRGLRHRARVSEPAVLVERLELVTPRRRGSAAAVRVVGRKRTTFTRAGTRRVTLKLSRSGKRAVRRAKTLRLRLRGSVTDGAGNTRRLAARRVVVRRR